MAVPRAGARPGDDLRLGAREAELSLAVVDGAAQAGRGPLVDCGEPKTISAWESGMGNTAAVRTSLLAIGLAIAGVTLPLRGQVARPRPRDSTQPQSSLPL